MPLRPPYEFTWKARGNICYWCGRKVSYYIDSRHPLRATREHLHTEDPAPFRIVVACYRCNSSRGRDMRWVPFHLITEEKSLPYMQALRLAEYSVWGTVRYEYEVATHW